MKSPHSFISHAVGQTHGDRWVLAKLRSLVSGVLDVIFPCMCVICGEEMSGGESLCGECERSLPRIRSPFCERCGERFEGQIEGAFECPNCKGLTFVFEFARPVLLRCREAIEMVHQLKYQRQVHMVHSMGRLLGEAMNDPRFAEAMAERWPLVPVPIHQRRMVQRHFNQAHELARPVGRAYGLPVVEMLERVRDTGTQTVLTRKKRLGNLHKAFRLSRRGEEWLMGGRRPGGVILVDDVLTTGSTLNECAKVLRKSGVRRVVAIALMRG